LLAAGQLVPLAGSLIDAIGARSPGWHQSAELSFDLPGYAPVAADFRLVAPATSDLQKLRYRANVGLIDRDDRLYTGDEPYVVIAVYGGERPELEGFTPGVVAADMARRFYPSKTGVATGLDDVLEIAKVASDWRFNRQATDLQARIAKTTDAAALEQLKRQLSAVSFRHPARDRQAELIESMHPLTGLPELGVGVKDRDGVKADGHVRGCAPGESDHLAEGHLRVVVTALLGL
jgi:hypothetical protein